jgi:hypothetical protein
MLGYTIASYTPDGFFVGKGEWDLSRLSEKWLTICKDIISRHGPVFQHNMGAALSYLDIAFMAGIGHFFVDGRPAFSLALLSGETVEQDENILTEFVQYLREDENVMDRCPDIDGFVESVKSHNDRPLCISVIWSDPVIDDKKYDAVMELGIHFAGAYLCYF